jgi:nitrate reductase molybdenum cofactor assembly chaperone NarJ/NarW
VGALPNRRALGLFANILEYPHPDVAADIHECEELLRAEHPEAAELMQRFGAFADAQPVGGLEETHTALFDLDSDLHPYIGYQLFGETYERSQLLLGLKELYRAGGFESKPTELPDRISEMLRYFSVGTNDAAIDEILREGMLPALESMTTNVEQDETQPTPVTDPYWLVIEALLLFLQPHAATAPAVAVTTGASQ